MVMAIGILGAVAAYWLLVIAEGAYFGPTVVTYLYDRGAAAYDALKDVPRGWDEERLAEPLLARLGNTSSTLVLDLATGTARLPMALLSDPAFAGTVVGLDLSSAMLGEAWAKVGGWSPRGQLLKAAVEPAPFCDAAFHAVTMLEALEFTPRPRRALTEMVRLLAQGGTLVVTNRIGWEARMLPRRVVGTDDLIHILEGYGLVGVTKEAWQTHYDLIWAVKPGTLAPAGRWEDALRCPACAGALTLVRDRDLMACAACGQETHWHDGYWDLQPGSRNEPVAPGLARA